MRNVIRLQYSQTGIWKTNRRRCLHRIMLIFTELERPLGRFCSSWWETWFRFAGHSWDVLEENKTGLKSGKIYITPGSEREVGRSDITFPSPRKIKFIAYHIFLARVSSNSHPKHSERTRTSICGVIQGLLLQTLSIAFPHEMQNITDQQKKDRNDIIYYLQFLALIEIKFASPARLIKWGCQ